MKLIITCRHSQCIDEKYILTLVVSIDQFCLKFHLFTLSTFKKLRRHTLE